MLGEKAEAIFNARYRLNEEETWSGCVNRVSKTAAEFEDDPNVWIEKFSWIIREKLFIPGGRILRNSGKRRTTLMNCHVLPLEDSIESIGELHKNCLILWSEGGGTGTNWSCLRPSGADIKTKGGNSSGMVSFLQSLDYSALPIESGGQRRAACIALCNIQHPEIINFMDAKLKEGRLNHHNISVAITEDFLKAVENGDDWNLEFGGKIYKTMQAEKLWMRIISNMLKMAEPGLINWTRIIKNNSYYFQPIQATNPCGELPLSAWESCCLGSLVLPKFLNKTQTNWKLLGEVIEIAVRFLDDIIDANHYSIKEMEIVSKNARKIGLGSMGLAEYLFGKQVRYGGEKSIIEIEKLYKFIRDKTYEVLVKLAIEKGPFPKFDRVAYGNASFIRKLPISLRRTIKKYGTRCCCALTVAPTGSTSLLVDTTSGIEPLYSKAYRRHDKLGERIYTHPLTLAFKESKKFPEWFVDSFDLAPEEHFETQAAVQKYIDGGISKTINLPKNTTADKLSELLLEYIWDLKGVTVYVDGSRKEQVLYRLQKKDINKYLKELSEELSEEDVQCKSKTCDL